MMSQLVTQRNFKNLSHLPPANGAALLHYPNFQKPSADLLTPGLENSVENVH